MTEPTADHVIEALTHGPTPTVDSWEIVESGYDDEGAWAQIDIDGWRFNVRVEAIADLVGGKLK